MPRLRPIALALGLVVVAALARAGSDSSGVQGRPAPEPRTAPPAELTRAARGIGRGDVQRHLQALAEVAARSGGNRAAGTPGDHATREYVSGRLRESGWRVTHQAVRFPFFEERRPPRLTLPGGERLRASDVRTMFYSGSGSADAPVAVVGTGCSRSVFRAVARGDVALLARGGCTFRRKARTAQAAGAAAALIRGYGDSGVISGSVGSPGIRIPVLALSGRGGRRVAAAGHVGLEVETVSENRASANVIAEAGAGSAVVMAGGHLDSVIEGPGLNDNATGIAALLALAEAFGGRSLGGARIRLGFWGAEELGLHGSRRYVRSLGRKARRSIRAYVNLDMVGTRRGTPRIYRTRERVARALQDGLRRRGRRSIRRIAVGKASDHAPFVAAGIPVGGIYTGTDRCYHRRCDGLQNVDPRLVADVAAATGQALVVLRRR